MSASRKILVGLALAAVAAAGVTAALVHGPSNHGSAGVARVLGPTDPHRRLGVSLVLQLPRRDALDRFLAASRDPRSPTYGQRLSPRAFGERFGISAARIASLHQALAAHGLAVARDYPQRTSLRVTGTAGLLQATFQTRLLDRVDELGQRYMAPDGRPKLPPWLRPDVVGVTGLNTRPVIRPADVPSGGLTPATLAAAYDFASLRSSGIDGRGQTIAVVSFDGYADSDLATYQSHFKIKGPSVSRVPIAGGTTPGEGQIEVNLDLDTLRGIAPGAQVLNYEAPKDRAGDADVLNAIVADGKAKVVSSSWGQCDATVPPAARESTENALKSATAAGITVFAASGDNGAYDCQQRNLNDKRLTVDYPAASANVVAVGGTRLAVRQNGSYLAEYGWQSVLSGAGSGGGLASVTPLPDWQRTPAVHNAASNGKRQVPDVAGPADSDSGMLIFSGGRFHQIGGTSAAAPFWAASLALIRQYADRQGARDLGFVAPLLYRVAANPATASALREPVRGGNRKYPTGPGWNYVTGLGSPDLAVLAKALVALVGHR